MQFVKRLNTTQIFAIILLIVSLLYNFQGIISQPPYSTHQWRQCDGMSISLNYYKEGMKFMEPKMHFQYSNEGRGVGEFPIVYYINAIIWKVTGHSHFTARLLNVIIAFFGFFALHKTVRLLLRDKFYSIIIPIFVFSSTLYAYYLSGFLVNVDAISFVFIAWYYIARYWKSKRTIDIILFSVAVTIAGLLRSTVLLGIAPFFLIYLLEVLGILKLKLFYKKGLSLLLLTLPIVILAIWLKFAMNYNEVNDSVYFLTKLRPIWAVDTKEISRIFTAFYTNLLPELFHYYIEIILAIVLLLGTIFIYKQNKYLVIIWFTILVEIVVYLLLWFLNLDVHDYYLLEVLILIPPLLLSLLLAIKEKNTKLFESKIMRVIVVLVLVFSINYTSISLKAKYQKVGNKYDRLFLSKKDIDFWNWYHWHYGNTFKAYENITPYLREIGIKREDVVLSIKDISPNISLYLMDQKGFTTLYQEGKSTVEQIDYSAKRGAKYLITNDTTIMLDKDMSKYREKKIGEYGNVQIFKL
ncbi:MAG: glycosyltransferase family 39 protein [Bacteroidales bacterium]|nr:glycosyltransferase family 39 protein [Bacteroidales bacterium]